jgi:hypothetical protein
LSLVRLGNDTMSGLRPVYCKVLSPDASLRQSGEMLSLWKSRWRDGPQGGSSRYRRPRRPKTGGTRTCDGDDGTSGWRGHSRLQITPASRCGPGLHRTRTFTDLGSRFEGQSKNDFPQRCWSRALRRPGWTRTRRLGLHFHSTKPIARRGERSSLVGWVP